MPLAVMGEIIGPARAAGRGVGAFNVIGIEHAEAIVTGAEAAGAPVVLQISEKLRRLARARLSPSPGPAWPWRARPRCRSPCTWTTRPVRSWSGRRPRSASGR